MLVNCQECDAKISDSAERCPKCGASPETFMGTPTACAECGVQLLTAHPVCTSCGAPRSIALAESPNRSDASQISVAKSEMLVDPVGQPAEQDTIQNRALEGEGLPYEWPGLSPPNRALEAASSSTASNSTLTTSSGASSSHGEKSEPGTNQRVATRSTIGNHRDLIGNFRQVVDVSVGRILGSILRIVAGLGWTMVGGAMLSSSGLLLGPAGLIAFIIVFPAPGIGLVADGVADLFRKRPKPFPLNEAESWATNKIVLAAIYGVFVLGAVGAAGLGYLMMTQVASTREAPQSIERIKADIIHTLESDAALGSFYQEFRTLFPGDYEQFVDAIARETHSGRLTNRTDTVRMVSAAIQDFRNRHAGAVAGADPKALAEIADKRAQIATTLQSGDPSTCVGFTLTGLPPDFRPTPEFRQHMAEAALLDLRAIKSGIARPTGALAAPNEQQKSALVAAMAASGLTAVQLDAYYNSTASLSLVEQCVVGVAEAKAIAEMPDDFSAYWTAYLLSSSMSSPTPK